MTEEEWLAARPDTILKFQRGKVSDRKLRLFACACVSRVWDLIVAEESRNAVVVAERFADGLATEIEREKAQVEAQRVWDKGDIYPHESEPPFAWLSDVLIRGEFVGDAWNFTEDRWASLIAAEVIEGIGEQEFAVQTAFCHDIFGNPFHPITLFPSWLTSTVVSLANQMYDSRDFSSMPILADALMDASCDNEEILIHCRGPGPHTRGCWVLDLLTDRE
jgi:hypothetical protein